MEVGLRWNLVDTSSGGRGEEFVHREGWDGDENFVAGFEESLAEQVNGFINAVGEQEFFWLQVELPGDAGFYGLALGIAREIFGAERLELLQHPGRAAERVLIEVATQAGTAAKRRVILRKRFDGGARLKHEDTSPAQIARAP